MPFSGLAGFVIWTTSYIAIAKIRVRNVDVVKPGEVGEDEPENSLSRRGQRALQPVLTYMDMFMACLGDPCDPKTNPGGLIALCVAENKVRRAKRA